jgi:hypothetical protein
MMWLCAHVRVRVHDLRVRVRVRVHALCVACIVWPSPFATPTNPLPPIPFLPTPFWSPTRMCVWLCVCVCGQVPVGGRQRQRVDGRLHVRRPSHPHAHGQLLPLRPQPRRVFQRHALPGVRWRGAVPACSPIVCKHWSTGCGCGCDSESVPVWGEGVCVCGCIVVWLCGCARGLVLVVPWLSFDGLEVGGGKPRWRRLCCTLCPLSVSVCCAANAVPVPARLPRRHAGQERLQSAGRHVSCTLS